MMTLLILSIGKRLRICEGFRLGDKILVHSLANVEIINVQFSVFKHFNFQYLLFRHFSFQYSVFKHFNFQYLDISIFNM